MDFITSKLKQGAGNVTKAVLVVQNPYFINEMAEKEFQSLKNSQAAKDAGLSDSAMHLAALSKVKGDENARMERSKEMTKTLMSEVDQLLKPDFFSTSVISFKNNAIEAAAKKNGYIMIEVMYNPATVRITSQGGKNTTYDRSGAAGGAAVSATTIRNLASTKSLSFMMIIEDLKNDDSFSSSQDGLINPTISGVIGEVTSIVDFVKNKSHSVKTKVEALQGLLLTYHLHEISFIYGKMLFTGVLNGLDVKYTMFNKKGNPVRAEISITITQFTDDNPGQFNEFWNKKYAQGFLDNKGFDLGQAIAGKLNLT